MLATILVFVLMLTAAQFSRLIPGGDTGTKKPEPIKDDMGE